MPEDKSSNETRIGALGGWIGVAGSAITIALTVWNVHTKDLIDATEVRLKARETELHERAEDLQESKAQIERYTWVRSLFPALKARDQQDRTLTLALIRLALKPDEAKALFGGLAQSSDQSLQEAGQKGLANLESEASNNLIFRINGDQAADRIAALTKLTQEYKGSPETISATLRLFEDDRFAELSSPGVINALYYLANTDSTVWNSEQVSAARKAIQKIQNRHPRGQTLAKVSALENFLDQVKPAF